ncbi:MAG: SufD family Fe-S cluster assembly protein [Acidaminococcus sp.]|jgi:Fe-S cluster assembly scaffold protein SufB|nr:SufD family Fe-S cluster assembly protein [Acidaminococcus sp.]MCI2099923.1 SufD family Fe-S cluster assembly protein [Acidaminococcus sp.]MCI2114154.1 SufD family Fe-S cluster assembly protein [Acidaminococcus sp.]MCI2116362.1 SufD family Fe-S cluster assembly protein [Acidaminococcus sp.]
MKQQFNELPRPTFKWMKVNHQELDAQKDVKLQSTMMRERHEGAAVVQFYNGNQLPDLGDFPGANKEVLAQAVKGGNVNCKITVPDGKKGAVWLEYQVTEAAPNLVGQLYIETGKNSDLRVYTLFEGDAPHGSINILHYVAAGEKSNVTVSKVQVQGSRIRHIDQRLVKDGAGSHVKFVSAEIGGHETLIYVKADLDHDDSEFKSQSMYLGAGEQLVDYSYWVPTKGCRTNTDILTTGALMDRSRKYFRGTIDFLRGGKKAVGSESDTCLLLNKGVHSISIPLLLCKEDDVEGNHASSSGQVDPDMLFYLMSRGFSEAGARLIIVESNIRPVIDQLGDDKLENRALQAVREKMQVCYQEGDCHDQCAKRFPNID